MIYVSTHAGKQHSISEDAVLIGSEVLTEASDTLPMPECGFICVADGVGGNRGGDQASQYVLGELSKYQETADVNLELVFISETWYNSSMKEVRAGRKPYPTDLTDSQWEEIEPLYSGMRNRKWSKRELTNAVLYIVKTGCQWRQLPHDFPPYQTVYSFFSRGAKSGLWEKILAHLVEKTRKDAGKSAEPHYALIDSQSVKTVADNEARGIDGGKKQKGANGMPS